MDKEELINFQKSIIRDKSTKIQGVHEYKFKCTFYIEANATGCNEINKAIRELFDEKGWDVRSLHTTWRFKHD